VVVDVLDALGVATADLERVEDVVASRVVLGVDIFGRERVEGAANFAVIVKLDARRDDCSGAEGGKKDVRSLDAHATDTAQSYAMNGVVNAILFEGPPSIIIDPLLSCSHLPGMWGGAVKPL